MKPMNKTCLFLILVFAISYSLAGIFYIIRDNFNQQIGFIILGTLYMFVPFISVLIVKKLHKEPLMSGLLISFKINRWFFIAWLLFPVIVFSSIAVSLLFPGISYNPEMTGIFERSPGLIPPEAIDEFKSRINSLPVNFVLLTLIQALIAGATVNAIAAFGEETAWRGFLLKEFKEMHFLKASLIIGFIWGIWHAPLILMGHNYPQHPQIGVLMMIIFCILLSPIMQYITIKSKSVIAAAIAHGSINAISGIAIMATSGGNDLTTGLTGLSGFITLLIFTAGFFVYDYFISKERIMVNVLQRFP